jgi:hypothetical protein
MENLVRDEGLKKIYEIEEALSRLWVLGDIGSDVKKEVMDKLELYRLRAEARNKDLRCAALRVGNRHFNSCNNCKVGKMVVVKVVVEGSDNDERVITERCDSCGNEEVWHGF